MSSGLDVAVGIVAEADRIEQDRAGKTLTDDEARMVRAAHFLRIIAPCLVPVTAQKGAADGGPDHV